MLVFTSGAARNAWHNLHRPRLVKHLIDGAGTLRIPMRRALACSTLTEWKYVTSGEITSIRLSRVPPIGEPAPAVAPLPPKPGVASTPSNDSTPQSAISTTIAMGWSVRRMPYQSDSKHPERCRAFDPREGRRTCRQVSRRLRAGLTVAPSSRSREPLMTSRRSELRLAHFPPSAPTCQFSMYAGGESRITIHTPRPTPNAAPAIQAATFPSTKSPANPPRTNGPRKRARSRRLRERQLRRPRLCRRRA